jgi:DNA-binding PadR family transcriptional regulator
MSPRIKIDSTLYISLLGFFFEKPNYGYEIYKYISNETSFFKIWFLKRSQFYGFLERLFTENYLSEKFIEGEQYPDRRIFSITDAGVKKLEDWIITPVNHGREMRQEFLAKLFIAHKIQKKKIKTLVGNQQIICAQWKHEQEKELLVENDQFQKLLINYRKMQIQSMLDWLDQISLS